MPATQRLRSACDSCHRLKVRCSGTRPCAACTASDAAAACVYSLSDRLGRPAGSRNKRQSTSLSLGRGAENGQQSIAARRNRDAGRLHNSSCSIPRIASQWANATASDGSTLDLGPDGSLVSPASMSAMPSSRPLASSMVLSRESCSWNHPGFPALSSPISPPPSNGAPDDQFRQMITSFAPGASSEDPFAAAHPPDAAPAASSFANVLGSEASSTAAARSTISSPTQCLCLPRQIALLSSLKRSEPGARDPSSAPRILASAREAHRVWLDLALCASCMRGDDEEVLLLALMSVRLVLTQLRRMCRPEDSSSSSSSSSSESSQPPDTIRHRGTEEAVVPVLVGDFEVTGHDRLVLLQVLRSMEVQRVEAALGAINDAFGRKRAALREADAGHGGKGAAVLEGDLVMSESDEMIGRLRKLARSLRAGG